MPLLIAGLVLFLGVHSIRIVADGWRTRVMQQRGEGAWKAVYMVASLAGMALIGWGWGLASQEPTVLWTAPRWTRHLAALLTLVAFILLTATYVPGNAIKARVHHPMILGVKVWALAHLLANNTLADVLLFGGFLTWAVFSFRAARARDRRAATVYAPGRAGPTAVTVLIGGLAWLAFAFWAHELLFGVRPLG